MENLNPSDVGVTVACLMFVVMKLLEMIKAKKPENDTNQAIRQQRYQDNIEMITKDIHKILEKLVDRTEGTQGIVKDIKNVQDTSLESLKSSHRRLGNVESHLSVFKDVLTKDVLEGIIRKSMNQNVCKAK